MLKVRTNFRSYVLLHTCNIVEFYTHAYEYLIFRFFCFFNNQRKTWKSICHTRDFLLIELHSIEFDLFNRMYFILYRVDSFWAETQVDYVFYQNCRVPSNVLKKKILLVQKINFCWINIVEVIRSSPEGISFCMECPISPSVIRLVWHLTCITASTVDDHCHRRFLRSRGWYSKSSLPGWRLHWQREFQLCA